jgi:predicted GH43/DUF377 family glycosyl hydrolase
MTNSALVRRTDVVLRPDPSRVIAKTFLPGQELLTLGQSRATDVLDRILDMAEDDVCRVLAATLESFGPRHRDLTATLESRFGLVEHRLDAPAAVSRERRLLIGAYFTQEYAVEAAALFNPSMVAHVSQAGLDAGSVRFVMSVRGVGEGHISSIGFRTGTIDASDNVVFDEMSPTTVLPHQVPTTYTKSVFAQQLVELGGDQSSADYVMAVLPPTFSRGHLDSALYRLNDQGLTRGSGASTVDQLEWIAACNYSTVFPVESSLQERVIFPGSPAETHGLEDVRLVRFTEPDGSVDYRGTYTAFDGSHVIPQSLRTKDFRTFHISQFSGSAAKDKGMALFPRRVGGQYLALSRWDRENNALAMSSDMQHWVELGTLQAPRRPWELVQLGNCGPPIETAAGWLVLTHGVGPMREYSIGAMLLDLQDPRIVLGQLREPLIRPVDPDRNGYVPNIVYSCGGMLHGDTLVLPYGCDDALIRVALIDVPALLAQLHVES